MIKDNLRNINKDSTLGELRTYNEAVSADVQGERLAQYFSAKPDLPGILIVDGDHLLGMVSRDVFYEKVGKRYGVAIYLSRPIRAMVDEYPFETLVLPSTSQIGDATSRALSREPAAAYEPVVVQWGRRQYSILEVLTLFVAQNFILQSLNADRYYTIQTGLPMSDTEALEHFLTYVSRPEDSFANLNQDYSVRCDRCGKVINYRLADVVHSFPDLEKGIFQEQRMGCSVLVRQSSLPCGLHRLCQKNRGLGVCQCMDTRSGIAECNYGSSSRLYDRKQRNVRPQPTFGRYGTLYRRLRTT